MAHRKMILTQAGVQSYRTRMLVGDPITLGASDARRLERLGWVEKPARRARRPRLDHDGNGSAGGSVTATGDDLPALRAVYRAKLGKNPFNGWDAATLKAKIAEEG
jgi:hypothetical protein